MKEGVAWNMQFPERHTVKYPVVCRFGKSLFGTQSKRTINCFRYISQMLTYFTTGRDEHVQININACKRFDYLYLSD